jgi:Kef-type K+ transport system membrane component KefB
MVVSIFVELGLIIIFSTILAGILKMLKQPILIGYIISGILLGPLIFNIIQASDVVNLFSHLGIAFLLFIVGLHLNPRILRKLGKVSLVAGIGQVIFTFLI